MRGARTSIALCALCISCAAGSANGPDAIGRSGSDEARAVDFNYDSLDARPVSAEAMRGQPTVLAFVTTWDLSSQAQIDFLVPMHKHDGDKVHYVMVALQENKDRDLVLAFRAGLHVEFPVALGDRESISGTGVFGDVHQVPTIIVLDRMGHIFWRKVGLARSDEIRGVLRKMPPHS